MTPVSRREDRSSCFCVDPMGEAVEPGIKEATERPQQDASGCSQEPSSELSVTPPDGLGVQATQVFGNLGIVLRQRHDAPDSRGGET